MPPLSSIELVVEPGDAVLVCVNGYFGQRLAEMARRYGGDVQTITRPWGEVFTPAEVKEALDARPAKVVALVHMAGAFAILSFLVIHLYMITTGHSIFAHTRAMITGWEEVKEGTRIEDWEQKKRKAPQTA